MALGYPAPYHRCLWPCAIILWPLVAVHIVLQAGCHPTAGDALEWQPSAAGSQLARGSALCMRTWCCRYSTRHVSGALSWMAGVFMLVWRAGACSHDGLTYQTLLPSSLGCHGTPVLVACNAQLIRVLRHCYAAAGTLGVFTMQPAPTRDYIAEYLI